MQYSKSFAYFAPSEQQRQPSTQTRARRRSSLDTFVIPSRTRLPSSNPSTFDLQVTKELLKSTLHPSPRRNMTSAESHAWSPDTSQAGCIPRRGANSSESSPLHHRVRPDIVKRPPPRFGGREVIVVPPQRPRTNAHQPAPQTLKSTLPQEHADAKTYDGVDDLVTVSRLTSTTWSTVSHRLYSDSSGSSRTMGAAHYRDEYNKLAEKHGLPRLEVASDGTSRNFLIVAPLSVSNVQGDLDDENRSQTKTTTKTHHAGWLARKLFRRSTSTYTLKAKTTYKPISKKKSFGGIPVLSEDRHKNILKGKSLEELSRLGGLSVLTLPSDFAVDKLTLPTCLSATAMYLYQHGYNAPGIFRVSGQTTIVNALYDFYDHQFANADAGSPSKVEQTVGSGLLPSHIEHTVPDVASFFKRVLIDLPGGLLGSVELFEALRNVTTNSWHDPELSESDLASVKAKLIALAISSVASDYRLYLIQAVLGLVSYLGHEAEKLQAETVAADEDQAPSELMNYRSLGVVLGPLLLGNLTDRAVHGSGEGHSGDPRTSVETDSAKKFRKHKRKHSDMKMDQSATLAAFVDRANRTAMVMQQLLLMWPDVVKQLRDINSTANSSLQSGSGRHLKMMPSRTGSRLTMKTSEEEMRFLDVLRGRTLPDEFRGAVRMKSDIRMRSRSPMNRGAIGPSGDEHAYDTRASPTADERHLGPNSGHTEIAKRAARDNERAVSSKLLLDEDTEASLTDIVGLGVDNRTPSDVAMDKMAMGTILPPFQHDPSSSSHIETLHLLDPVIETPGKRQDSGSSSETPQTALRDAPLGGRSHESEESQLQISMQKPLPPIRDAQRAELSNLESEGTVLDPPPRVFARNEHPTSYSRNISSGKSSSSSFSSREARQSAERTMFLSRQSGQLPSSPTKMTEENAMFPPRQSSLPMEKHLPLEPIETYNTIGEYKARADSYMPPPTSNVLRKATETQIEQNGGPHRRNNVKFLAQRFAEASRAMRRSNEQAKETATPTIHAFVKPLPSPESPMLGLEDPFLSAESNNVSRESLIPRPVRDVGRSRESRSLSPPKRPAPKAYDAKRRSAFGIVADRDAEIVQNNSLPNVPTRLNPAQGEISEDMITNSNGLGFQKSSPETKRLHSRTISFAELARPISLPPPDSPSTSVYADRKSSHPRSNSYLDASDALKPLERHASINATMYREICRLQRLLQQMGEEREAKDRRIEALEEVQGANPVAAGITSKGSFGKGGLHNEVRKAKREVSLWKTRAELAEKRLSGLKQLSDRSWENETMYPGCPKPSERSEIAHDQDSESDANDVQDVQGNSPGAWKRRAVVAESQLAQLVPLIDESTHGEMRRTIPPPTTAKIHLAVETETGEKGETFWDWWEEGRRSPRSPNIGKHSWSNSEKEVDRPRPVEKSRGSDDDSSDFASAVNGFG